MNILSPDWLSDQLRCSLIRSDAFTQQPTTRHTPLFEKESVLFNIAALFSSCASCEVRRSEPKFDVAHSYFEASAGMFSYLSTFFPGDTSFDMRKDTVHVLKTIMLAQAQEMFLHLQIQQEECGPEKLAQWAAKAADFYSQGFEGMRAHSSRAIFERNCWVKVAEVREPSSTWDRCLSGSDTHFRRRD